MSTLHQTPSFVHPFDAAIRIVGLPEVLADVEPFMSPEDVGYCPSPTEEAWKLAFDASFAGEPADYPTPKPPLAIREAVYLAHLRGDREGRLARETREAFEVGKTLGIISDICCPPSGYAPHQSEGYRKGFAAGQADFDAAVRFEAEDDARTEAQIKHMEAERLHDALHVEITDADAWPLGCAS
jgi:hypothetical protein